MRCSPRLLLVGLAAALAVAAPSAAAAQGPTSATTEGADVVDSPKTHAAAPTRGPVVPKGLFRRTLRLDVDLRSFEAGVFTASLNAVGRGVGKRHAAYLTRALGTTTFEITTGLRTACVVEAAKVPCSTLAARLDGAADGLRATVLVQPAKGRRDAAGDVSTETEPALSFRARKVTAV